LGTVSLGSIASGASSADGFPKSNDVQWQQHQMQEKDGGQTLDRAELMKPMLLKMAMVRSRRMSLAGQQNQR